MGSSTSVLSNASSTSFFIGAGCGCDNDFKNNGGNRDTDDKEDEVDVFTEDEVNQLLDAVSGSFTIATSPVECEILKSASCGDELQSLLDGYKSSFLRHFCVMKEEDEATIAPLIRRSSILNLSAEVVDLYLHERIGVINSLHRQLMCQYITKYGAACRERHAIELAEQAAANAIATVKDSDTTSALEKNNCTELAKQLNVQRPAISRRKTQRFITHIDVAERRITCVRRAVSSSDYAISHRWQTRPTNSQWMIVPHTHTESCWDGTGEDLCPYIDYHPCAVVGEGLYYNYIQKDWTVVCTCEEDMGGRMLSYPDRSYKCSLHAKEVDHLSALLITKKSLWCDYICINQADPCDKMEQMPLMGNLYFTACTLILGEHLASCLPPDDYIFRAWCMQERDYGAIEFSHWDLSNLRCDNLSFRQFVCEVLKRIPAFVSASAFAPVVSPVLDLGKHAAHGNNLCAVFEYVRCFNFENEPISEMTPDNMATLTAVIQQFFNEHLVKLYPQYKIQFLQIVQELLVALRKVDYDEDDLHISRCFLKLREIITCPQEVQPLACQYQMFHSQASLIEDRLYAAWSVPMWMHKQQQLPYPRLADALRLIYKAYPSAEVAFYRRPQAFVPFTFFTQVQDLMLHFLTNGQCAAKAYPCAYHAYVITSGGPDAGNHQYAQQTTKKPTQESLSSSIVVAVNAHCIGVGVKEAHQNDDQAVMWVVFNKQVLRLQFDSDLDLFCRLCFLYVLYEVGLFNNDNLVERKKLYKFCCQFI